jgi:polysaccharide biosynthesis protein PslJ
MTATGDALAADAAAPPPPARSPAQLRSLRPTVATWPIWAMTAGMPLAYLFGVHGFVWCLPGLVFGARILSDRNVRFPKSTLPLLAFLGWTILSATMIGSGTGIALFAYRWLLFAGALTSLVWLVNVPRERVPSEQIVNWLAALWILLVAFGYLGILLPNFVEKSPFQVLLGPIGDVGFIDEIARWRFAETQGFLGYQIARPSAPFNATNGWGAAMGILTPFFVHSWIVQPDRARRRRGYLIGVAAVYPMLVSVNRGLWISLAVGLVYFAARKALRGQLGPFLVLVGTLVAVTALLVVTPAGKLVADKLDKSDRSNDSRSNLYEQAFEGAQQSPLIGNGAPRRAEGAPPGMPPVGTHGMLWYLMFVHGFVGLVLFLTWLGGEVLRSGRVRTADGWWTHLALVIGLVQVPFYGLLPQVVLFGIAAGLSHREDPR